MVLDDDAWNEALPPSDNDAYSSGGPRQINIDTSQLPRPMPILGPLFGFNSTMIVKQVQEQAHHVTQKLKREPTDDEINAFAYWTAKQAAIMSYATPTGLGAGLWRAHNTAETFRFPFYQPNPDTFSKFSFPHTRLALLRGNLAVGAWHVLRGGLYAFNGYVIAGVLFGSYAFSVGMVGQLGDKRLKGFLEGLKQEAQRKVALQQPVPGQGQQTSPVPGRVRRHPYPPIPPQSKHGEVDDASPTGGGMWMGEDDAEDTQWKSPPSQQSSKQQQEPQWKPAPQSRPAAAQTQGPDTQSQPFGIWDDDDASPTAPPQKTPQQPQRQQRGSAWDRIRRGEKPAPAENAENWDHVRKTRGSEWELGQEQEQRDSRKGATPGERYSFSKADEDRNVAKEEAQKDFDARVEKERRGGDFSAGGEDQKRW